MYKSPQYFLPSFKSVGPLVQEFKIHVGFQDGGCGGRLGFLIGKILAIFYQQVALVLPTMFLVNWPFGS